MSEGAVRFCMRCGAPMAGAERFCARCGAPRADAGASSAPGAAVPAASSAAQAVGTLRTAYSAAGSVAGIAGVMPWQTLAGQEGPDMRAFLSASAMPMAQRAVAASLRVPGAAMLVTTLLDLAVVLIGGQPAALRAVAFRTVAGLATAGLSMIAGRKTGPLRALTGVSSGVTALVGIVTLAYTAFSGISAPTTLLPLVPSAISQLSMLGMAAKTAYASFRKVEQ